MKSLKLLFIGSVAQAGLICEHPKLTKIQNEIKEIFQIKILSIVSIFQLIFHPIVTPIIFLSPAYNPMHSVLFDVYTSWSGSNNNYLSIVSNIFNLIILSNWTIFLIFFGTIKKNNFDFIYNGTIYQL